MARYWQVVCQICDKVIGHVGTVDDQDVAETKARAFCEEAANKHATGGHLAYMVAYHYTAVPVRPPGPAYRCRECGWTGREDQMQSNSALSNPDGDEMFCGTICPQCRTWQELDEYDRLEIAPRGAPDGLLEGTVAGTRAPRDRLG